MGLNPRSVSTTFGCRVNIAICLRGASDPDPAPAYVDQRALRNDRVTLVEKGSPHSLCLLESGKVRSTFLRIAFVYFDILAFAGCQSCYCESGK